MGDRRVRRGWGWGSPACSRAGIAVASEGRVAAAVVEEDLGGREEAASAGLGRNGCSVPHWIGDVAVAGDHHAVVDGVPRTLECGDHSDAVRVRFSGDPVPSAVVRRGVA